jgi:hypothetical protein
MNTKPLTLLFSKAFLFLKDLKNIKYEYLPKRNEPYAILAKVPKNTNKIIQLRFYDSSGYAYLDIDFSHHNKPEKHPKNMPNGAHKHVWDFSKSTERSKALEMTNDEYKTFIENINNINYKIKYVDVYKKKNKKNLYDKNKK